MTQISNAFNTLANIAGGRIVDNKFIKNHTTTATKVRIDHEPTEFYCLTVPTSAFLIRSNGHISITGNCHVEAMIKLFRTYIEENRHLWNDELKRKLYDTAERMVELEDHFIDLCFSCFPQGEMDGLTSAEVKQYIRYIADRRLIAMGLRGIFKVKKNPLPWVDEMINAPVHGNFFENRIIDYAKGAVTGSWDEVWAQ